MKTLLFILILIVLLSYYEAYGKRSSSISRSRSRTRSSIRRSGSTSSFRGSKSLSRKYRGKKIRFNPSKYEITVSSTEFEFSEDSSSEDWNNDDDDEDDSMFQDLINNYQKQADKLKDNYNKQAITVRNNTNQINQQFLDDNLDQIFDDTVNNLQNIQKDLDDMDQKKMKKYLNGYKNHTKNQIKKQDNTLEGILQCEKQCQCPDESDQCKKEVIDYQECIWKGFNIMCVQARAYQNKDKEQLSPDELEIVKSCYEVCGGEYLVDDGAQQLGYCFIECKGNIMKFTVLFLVLFLSLFV